MQITQSTLTGAAGALAAATVYRARCGRRRSYKTAGDAEAYERGFEAYPGTIVEAGDAYRDGWFDACDDRTMVDDARADAAFERKEF